MELRDSEDFLQRRLPDLVPIEYLKELMLFVLKYSIFEYYDSVFIQGCDVVVCVSIIRFTTCDVIKTFQIRILKATEKSDDMLRLNSVYGSGFTDAQASPSVIHHNVRKVR